MSHSTKSLGKVTERHQQSFLIAVFKALIEHSYSHFRMFAVHIRHAFIKRDGSL